MNGVEHAWPELWGLDCGRPWVPDERRPWAPGGQLRLRTVSQSQNYEFRAHDPCLRSVRLREESHCRKSLDRCTGHVASSPRRSVSHTDCALHQPRGFARNCAVARTQSQAEVALTAEAAEAQRTTSPHIAGRAPRHWPSPPIACTLVYRTVLRTSTGGDPPHQEDHTTNRTCMSLVRSGWDRTRRHQLCSFSCAWL